jgi:hypothetical protein
VELDDVLSCRLLPQQLLLYDLWANIVKVFLAVQRLLPTMVQELLMPPSRLMSERLVLLATLLVEALLLVHAVM